MSFYPLVCEKVDEKLIEGRRSDQRETGVRCEVTKPVNVTVRLL